jgi:endoglycosylceramidase
VQVQMPLRKGARARAALAVWLLAGLALPACDLVFPGLPPSPAAPRAAFRLPALHAEPDPVRGGRIVDALGREVILRGVNVNALVEYWAYDASRFTTYPLTEGDADLLAAQGFDVVRLLLSWSRVEPLPGTYDEAYLDEVEAAVRLLESRGLYSIVDLHQDAWGPSLAARPGESCAGIGVPAFGWDGAPAWATFDGGRPRCAPGGQRELSPAVMAAFQAFWNDAPGPGGVGIRTRYARMLGHVAARLSRHAAVAGYDVMNEPNAIWLAPGQLEALADLYGDAIAEIRAGEAAAGAPRRLVFFEPAITWADFGEGAPPDFPRDDQIVYSPHVYQGGINALPLDRAPFERARAEAAVFGGAPVVIGEWGSGPERAADPRDGYFDLHLALQDEYRFGSTLWTWREACGDPHKAGDYRDGRVPYVWGFFEVDCAENRVVGTREPLARKLRRALLRHAPGRLDTIETEDGLLATGEGRAGDLYVAFLPTSAPGAPIVEGQGLGFSTWRPAPGGLYVLGSARGGPFRLSLRAP